VRDRASDEAESSAVAATNARLLEIIML